MFKNIGLIGKAQAGKDTAAQRLVTWFDFNRVAFADPLKAHALRIDPLIPTGYAVHVRLSRLVADVGWDYAKTHYPEVRRMLQYAGQAVREIDPEFWIRAALNEIDANEAAKWPTVVTDVRYANEARALLARGFMLVRVIRPNALDATIGAAARHPSETELDRWLFPCVLDNSGTVAELYEQVDRLPRKR